MAANIKIEVKGLEKLESLLKKAPGKIISALRDASTKSAFLVEGRSKKLSPVDTGRLRSSIATSLSIADQGITSIVATNVDYAIYVHEGTRRMAGRPFMKQAADQSESEIGRIYSSAVKDAINATL